MYSTKYIISILLLVFCYKYLYSGDSLIVKSYILEDGEQIPNAGIEYLKKQKTFLDSVSREFPVHKKEKSSIRKLPKQSSTRFEELRINYDTYTLKYQGVRSLGAQKEDSYSVLLNGKSILDFKVLTPQPVDPIHAFFEFQDKWVLEYYNTVLINGVNLNQKYGYDVSFYARKLSENLVYFAKKNGKIYLVINNKLTNYCYDKIMVYLCCGPSQFNPRISNSILDFYAKKDKKTYLIKAYFTD